MENDYVLSVFFNLENSLSLYIYMRTFWRDFLELKLQKTFKNMKIG